MGFSAPRVGNNRTINIQATAAMIADCQCPDGEIPWNGTGYSDPWDHVEAAMGLGIGGLHLQAEKAYRWLARRQLADGSWYAAYHHGRPGDRTRDANRCAYFATGAYHHFLMTGDDAFLDTLWPSVSAAIEFVLSLQAPGGEIYWAISPQGQVDTMALLTGSSSVYMSLKCALAIARRLNRPRPHWRSALSRLGNAILNHPQRFNMTKSRYAMDWYYPVLCGAVGGERAQQRIDRSWEKFVVEGHGVRCVSDRPWITIAETCELVITLAAIGRQAQAQMVFEWIVPRKYADEAYWCGYTLPDLSVWPPEKTTWTNAVVLLALDSLHQLTPAAKLFCHRFWQSSGSPSSQTPISRGPESRKRLRPQG